MGHDWGGSLVWNMAQFHPERVRYCISERIINKMIQECHECWFSLMSVMHRNANFSSHVNHFILTCRAVASLNTPLFPVDPKTNPMEKLMAMPIFDYQIYFQKPVSDY